MLCTALGVDPTEMVRFNEQEAKDLGLKKTDTRLRADWLNLLAEYPRLIERPIVLRGEKAVIGRPPEKCRGIALTREVADKALCPRSGAQCRRHSARSAVSLR